jgi:predicted dehydrogenase
VRSALVVGAGRMGRLHARVLTDLGYAVTTEDPVAPADVRYLHPSRRRRFDVVCVAVPIRALAWEAVTLQGHRGRLLVEKPFAATVGEAMIARDVLRRQRVAVGYVERFNPRAVELRDRLHGRTVKGAVFVRCNDRPTPDLDLDLRSHDLDLAYWLGIPWARCAFIATGNGPVKRREIHVDVAGGERITVDLMDHAQQPLRDQWKAFLAGRPGPASVDDAVRVLGRLRPDVALAA